MDNAFYHTWHSTTAGEVHHGATSGASLVPAGSWEEFMQWAPGQGQEQTRSQPTSQEDARLAEGDPQQQSLYARRTGLGDSQMLLGIGEGFAFGSSNASTSPSLPFTYAQTVGPAIPFEFTPDALPSQLGIHNLPFESNGPGTSSPSENSGIASTTSPSLSQTAPQSETGWQTRHSASLQRSPDLLSANLSHSGSVSSASDLNPHLTSKKRKSDDSDNASCGIKFQPPKKTAHNMIEKRYRTNLNEKIKALQQAVPSLRALARNNKNNDEEDEEAEEDLEGIAPAHKLNKATILSKATEYISHLEKRNVRMVDEISLLKMKIAAFEKLSVSGFAHQTSNTNGTAQDQGLRYGHPYSQASSTSMVAQAPQHNMIAVPEDMQAIHHASMHQPSYATSGDSYVSYATAPSRSMRGRSMATGRGSGFVDKLMVGSLAGLMLLEGFVERDSSLNEPSSRGLFAIPSSLISHFVRWLYPRQMFFGASPQAAIFSLKLFMILGAFGYVFLPMLDIRARPKQKGPAIRLKPAPSLAHPVELRRRAWLTAIQTVWVPRHQFLLEVAALLLKTLKLSTRKLIGWQGYAWVWNVTQEQEEARVKAWDIALDAQLTGGDAEISLSRLVLTMLASGTLPDTPDRLMRKALHIRVLLWEVAKAGYETWYMFDELSMKLARYYWNQARVECKRMETAMDRRDPQRNGEILPPHLLALIELECDAVLIKPVVQRAYNLAWNLPGSDNTGEDDSTDIVVGDFAISSPLDALAAWLSNHVTNNVLEYSLLAQDTTVLMQDLEVAISIAPPTSAILVRALAAKAVLGTEDRLKNIDVAYSAMPRPSSSHAKSNSTPSSPRALLIERTPAAPDVPASLVLAKCLALAGAPASQSEHPEARRTAVMMFLSCRPSDTNLSLLTFAAAFRLLDSFMADRRLLSDTRPALEKLAISMRLWIGCKDRNPAVSALNVGVRKATIERCIATSKLLADFEREEDGDDEETDAGYGSLEEEEVKREDAARSVPK